MEFGIYGLGPYYFSCEEKIIYIYNNLFKFYSHYRLEKDIKNKNEFINKCTEIYKENLEKKF